MDFSRWLQSLDKHCQPRTLYASLLGFVILLLSNGQSILSAYTSDDYASLYSPHHAGFFLQQGRFIQALHVLSYNYLNISISDVGVSAYLILFAVASVAVVYVLDTVTEQRGGIHSLAAPVLLLLTSPFFSTLFVYRRAAIHSTMAFFLFLIFVLFYRKFQSSQRVAYLAYSSLFLALSLGAYQALFPIAVLLAGWLLLLSEQKLSVRLIALRFLPVLSGLFVYAVIVWLTYSLDGYGGDSRGGLLSLTHYKERFFEVCSSINQLLFNGNYIIIPQYTILYTTCTLFGILLLIPRIGIIRALIGCISSIIVVMAPVAILGIWDPSPRALLSFPFIGAMLVAIGLSRSINVSLYGVLLTPIIACAIVGTAISESFYLRVEQVNNHNQFVVSNIMVDYLKHDYSPRDVKVVFTQGGPLKTQEWALNGIFFSATGYRLPFSLTNASDREQCAGFPKWPKEGYMTLVEDTVYICLE